MGVLLALKRGSFFGLLLLGQGLNDLLLLGLQTLFSALTGLPGLGAASLSLVTVCGEGRRSEVSFNRVLHTSTCQSTTHDADISKQKSYSTGVVVRGEALAGHFTLLRVGQEDTCAHIHLWL